MDAAAPALCVPQHLPPPPPGRTVVVGAGKAAAAMAQAVEAHWPDRWGVLVQVTADDIPRRYPRTGLVLNVLGGLAAVEDRRTVEVVGALVRERVPAFMGVKGPPGFGGTKVFLNDQLARAAKQRSGDRLRDALVDEYLFALAQPKLPTAAA